MILIARSAYAYLASICHCVASSVRLAPALILVLGIAFGSVASAQTAHFSYAQVLVGSGFTQPAGVAVDGSGNVFVADQGDNAVNEIVAVNGVVSSTRRSTPWAAASAIPLALRWTEVGTSSSPIPATMR